MMLWMCGLKGETKQVDQSSVESYQKYRPHLFRMNTAGVWESSKSKYHAETGGGLDGLLVLLVTALNTILHSANRLPHRGH